ncbi:MAG: hypothetical protein ACI4M4_03415 [Candidatus Ornithospirochaeta sp.]
MRGNCQQRKGNKRRREEKGKKNYLKTVFSFIDIHPKFFSSSIHIFLESVMKGTLGRMLKLSRKEQFCSFEGTFTLSVPV